MSPDLNTVPLSPRADRNVSSSTVPHSLSPSLSRRTSYPMGPPPLPSSSSQPNSPRPSEGVILDNTGVGIGPGPLRHPRPLTAAELHLELEKEQEGIVNRLTRELSALRAQTASVASTASTSSELFTTTSDSSYPPYTPFATSGSTVIVPTSARRHRSSSNLSARSGRSIRDTAQNATSVSGVAAPRDPPTYNAPSSRTSIDLSHGPRPEVSRQNSASASNPASRVSSNPVPSSPYHSHAHRHSSSTTNTMMANSPPPVGLDGTGAMNPMTHPRSPSFSAAIAAARYEEAAFHRAELDAVKRENEMLKQRIRDLERRVGEATRRRSSLGSAVAGTDNTGIANDGSENQVTD